MLKVISKAPAESSEGIFRDMEERIQALYRPYLPRGIPERTLLLLVSALQASFTSPYLCMQFICDCRPCKSDLGSCRFSVMVMLACYRDKHCMIHQDAVLQTSVPLSIGKSEGR